jgi:hypothetical protein
LKSPVFNVSNLPCYICLELSPEKVEPATLKEDRIKEKSELTKPNDQIKVGLYLIVDLKKSFS